MKKMPRFQRFLRNTSGNIALTTALMIVPLALAGGVALDYSRLSQKSTDLQTAVDAAAIVGARAAIDGEGGVKKAVRKFLKANLSPEALSELKNIKVDYNKKTGKITVTANSESPTTLMKVAGIEKLNYSPTAAVNIPNGNLEIVLVLDSTGSMATDGKMDALKVAAKEFVNDMLALNDVQERVQIGIVPFSEYVNVGIHNRNASWLDVDDDSSETKTRQVTTEKDTSSCTEKTYNDDGVTKTYTSCDSKPLAEPYEEEYTSTRKWNGCVGSRQYPLNLEDRNYNKKIPGLMNAWCSRPITPMTAVQKTLEAEINALSPNKSTYIPTGLVWGLRTISSKAPFTDGLTYKKAEKSKTQKIIVLMSDGENQNSANLPNSAWHTGSNLTEANKWTTKACDNIKKEDIKLFTIAFGKTISEDTKELLKNCSTDSNNYMAAADNKALSESFQEISEQLSQIYLSQ